MERYIGPNRRSMESYVNPVWKWIAMFAIGALCGGAPNYIQLEISQSKAVTLVDVDREISVQQAAIVQRLDDLKGQVGDLSLQLQRENLKERR